MKTIIYLFLHFFRFSRDRPKKVRFSGFAIFDFLLVFAYSNQASLIIFDPEIRRFYRVLREFEPSKFDYST